MERKKLKVLCAKVLTPLFCECQFPSEVSWWLQAKFFEPLCSRSGNLSVTSSGRRASAEPFSSFMSFVDHSPPFPPLHYPLIQLCVLLFSRPGQDNLLFWRCHNWAQNVTHLVYDMHVMLNISFHSFFSLLVNRSTLFSEPDWHKGITWNPGPECSHKEEKECGDTVDCWNGERFLLPFGSVRACCK